MAIGTAITYYFSLSTSYSRAFLEKLIVTELVKTLNLCCLKYHYCSKQSVTGPYPFVQVEFRLYLTKQHAVKMQLSLN
jgi:hypothetical protein